MAAVMPMWSVVVEGGIVCGVVAVVIVGGVVVAGVLCVVAGGEVVAVGVGVVGRENWAEQRASYARSQRPRGERAHGFGPPGRERG